MIKERTTENLANNDQVRYTDGVDKACANRCTPKTKNESQGGVELNFGHIVLEGYCFHADEPVAVPCAGEHIVSEKCFMEDRTICPFFGWCSAKDYIVMTGSNGKEIGCASYTEGKRNELKRILLEQSDET